MKWVDFAEAVLNELFNEREYVCQLTVKNYLLSTRLTPTDKRLSTGAGILTMVPSARFSPLSHVC